MSGAMLAGDVGGTKANVALFCVEGEHLGVVREATLPSREFSSLTDLLRAFLGKTPPPIAAACLGVAGPVQQERVTAPNLPWKVEGAEVRATLGLKEVHLINDLLATAYGIRELPEESFAELNRGAPQEGGAIALIAAGTGLGQAILFWDGEKYVPCPSEGGHADFAPVGETQIALLKYLDAKYGRTSFERVLSGSGLGDVYRYLVETGEGAESAWVAARMTTEDPAAVISEVALEKKDDLCEQALDLFVRVYGAEAGNLALKALATGGVYVGGGIAPKILPKLREGGFWEAFCSKGRLSALLEEVPVRIILDPKAALYGAGRYAALRFRGRA